MVTLSPTFGPTLLLKYRARPGELHLNHFDFDRQRQRRFVCPKICSIPRFTDSKFHAVISHFLASGGFLLPVTGKCRSARHVTHVIRVLHCLAILSFSEFNFIMGDFEKAVDDISNKVNKTMTDDELKEIYALYKQGTVGDVNTDRPGMLDFKVLCNLISYYLE